MQKHVRCLIALAIFLANNASAASLPAPGSTYHLLFATSGQYRTTISTLVPPPTLRFNLIAGADWQVTSAAADAYLPPDTLHWNGIQPIYRAILSVSGDNARDRLSVSGPVFNMHGDELATGHADLFDGSIAAPVAYDEFGNLITSNPDVWTGCVPDGTAGGQACGSWNNVSSSVSGRIGDALAQGTSWLGGGVTKACNLGARLYGLSPALTAPLWGDYDGSGKVDGRDFLEWQRYYAAGPNTSTSLPLAFYSARSFLDGNLTQAVGAVDLEVWAAHYGQSLPMAVTSVPEPATSVLLVGLVVVSLSRHRPSHARGDSV